MTLKEYVEKTFQGNRRSLASQKRGCAAAKAEKVGPPKCKRTAFLAQFKQGNVQEIVTEYQGKTEKKDAAAAETIGELAGLKNGVNCRQIKVRGRAIRAAHKKSRANAGESMVGFFAVGSQGELVPGILPAAKNAECEGIRHRTV